MVMMWDNTPGFPTEAHLHHSHQPIKKVFPLQLSPTLGIYLLKDTEEM